MKNILLLAGAAIVLTGCYTKKEVVYEPAPRTTIVRETAPRTTIVREPAAAVRVYEAPPTRYYYYDRAGQRKLGEYHVR